MNAWPYELRTWYPGLLSSDGRRASTIDVAEVLFFASEGEARAAAAGREVRHGVQPVSAIFLDGVRIDVPS